MRKLTFSLFLSFSLFSSTFAQKPHQPSSSEIFSSIQKLNFLGSVLYVAAHPDDENTALISYFANDVHARTGYISITRGDGGQNLIGSELREYLGVIRTQELLQARKIDGGIQFFTRANDFGFSKNPTETFNFWDKNQVLNDLVYVIRKFQPDIIINRFDARTPGSTHGHHTASALLSVEAFDLAHDKSKYQYQLKTTQVWQPKRLFFNDSWFFYNSKTDFEKANHSNMFSLNIGSYYPGLGKSNSEIAAESRSQHRSQGFGTTAVRGNTIEYLEPIKGGMPNKNIFDGIDTSWKRVRGGEKIGEILARVEKNFDFNHPSASVPELIKAYQLINKLENQHWKSIKLEEIKNCIIACSGLYLEASTSTKSAIDGEIISIKSEATNRSPISIHLDSYAINGQVFNINKNLENNQQHIFEIEYQIPQKQKPTTPYWLEEQGTEGMYKVSNNNNIGLPEEPAAFLETFNLKIEGEAISISRPVNYKYNNPAKGEIQQAFNITPKASVKVNNQVIVVSGNTSKKLSVNVKSFIDHLNGKLELKAPKGWVVNPQHINLSIDKKGETKEYQFDIIPPKNITSGSLIPELNIDGDVLSNQVVNINYEHIPEQQILVSGSAKLVHIDLKIKGNKIGYINGAGDSVAENLSQIGYEVDHISPESITSENLAKYDAIVLGVRAFNVIPELRYKNKVLFKYVENGGNLVVQYNVSRGLVTTDIGPYPITLSSNRVTDEKSEVRFTDKNSLILNQPNKITDLDFNDWVQERGLYFPSQWDKHYNTLVSMNDQNEEGLDSSILYTKYGKGYYVYTGLSFFRELPAGVSGAYKLFSNLLSLGK